MQLHSWWLSLVHAAVARAPFPGRGVLERLSSRLARGTNAVRVRPGFLIGLDLANEYERLIFIGAYEAELLRLIQAVLRHGDLFIDGGANVGVHMLSAAIGVGERGAVLAFEPDDEAYVRAHANLALNPGLLARVSLKRTALGDKVGTLALSHAGDRHLESRITETGDVVSCTTLNAELLNTDLPPDRVVMCKLDVEGYELRVLDGAKKLLERQETIFVCELNDSLLRSNGGSADELITRLRSSGFSGWTEAAAPLERHDATWAPWVNGIFAKGPLVEARLKAAFQGCQGTGKQAVRA